MITKKKLVTLLTCIILTITGCNSVKTSNDFCLSVGNADVPVGRYTLKIFDYYGIDENKAKSHISYGSNVKEVTTAISEGAADCGIVYATDAYFSNLKIVATADENICGRVLYPAAILKDSSNKTCAQHFLEYLQTDEAWSIFSKAGFIRVSSFPDDIYASEDDGEVIIFAASSMTEVLTDISNEYKKVAPDVKLVFNFDSSGTLKSQIEEGADCDIFISASEDHMDMLDITCDDTDNPNRLDCLDSETRIDLLENKVVLCVNENSRYKVDSFETLGNILKEQ